MQKQIFGANLKMMNPVPEGTISFSQLERLLKAYEKLGITSNEIAEIIVFPPTLHLDHTADLLTRLVHTDLKLGSQACSEYSSGPHTGDSPSPVHLREIGVSHVLIGHSEVRAQYEELAQGSNYIPTQIRINEKFNHQIRAGLQQGLKVIYCVGETQEERSLISEVIERQIKIGLMGLSKEQLEELTIAYEPRWAIGGNKQPPTPDEIRYANNRILMYMNDIGHHMIELTPVLYGGSMNSSNAKAIMEIPGVCGGLVGSACLKSEEFAKIVNYRTTLA